MLLLFLAWGSLLCVPVVFPLSCFWFLPVPSLGCCLSVVSCFPPSAPWLKLRFPFAPLSLDRSWIMLKDERSIIIWLELLCISTIWQGSCLSSSPPLNMMKRRLRPISVLIIQTPEACTLLYLARHPKVLRPWYHMEASLPTWS